MKIASFNANSIRNRIDVILNWMNETACDVVCVQETKVRDEEFPIDKILESGLNCVYKGQKAYNGVAIISSKSIEESFLNSGIEEIDSEARFIRARINGIDIVNTYVPQGTALDSPKFAYKLSWIRNMRTYFEKEFQPTDNVVWLGDFNVALEPIDVYDPEGFYGGVCFHPEEHKAYNFVKEWGFTDVFRMHHKDEEKQYTFWDYRIPNGFKRKMGWRLDDIWVTNPLAEKCISCNIDTAPRQLEKPSDHTFIAAEFDI